MNRKLEINAETLRNLFDWSNTNPDMLDRIISSIVSQAEKIVECVGPLRANTVITWADYGYLSPLDAGNISFRCGLDDVEEGESVLATPIYKSTTQGTNWFPTFLQALRYYRPYGYSARDIRCKIDAGKIKIGRPPVQAGERWFIRDNRWHVEK